MIEEENETIDMNKSIFRQLWVLALFIIGSLLSSCFFKKNSAEVKLEELISGTYILDSNTSDLSSYEVKEFKTLTLILRDDHTYAFSAAVPFLLKKEGAWYYEDDGEMGFAVLEVTNSHKIYATFTDSRLIMEYPLSSHDNPSVARLEFVKLTR